MENINLSEEQLNILANSVADEIVKRIYGVQNLEDVNADSQSIEDSDMMWYADRDDDHVVGELARLMTLMNIYEEREEYEKCHLINKHVKRLTKIVENL